MLSEFEEKQYEQHLNLELLQGTNLIFPPGQYLENILGFDAALFTKNKHFWRLFLSDQPWYRRFLRNYPSGLYFPKEVYKIEEEFNNYFPTFKFNIFIQHKRAERMVKDTAAEWDSWNQEYYRYKVLEHQQAILEVLERNIGGQGIVTYASPAFHTMQEFWKYHKSQSFIQNSNFCQPIKLAGHKAYTYIFAGTSGVAHSKPEKIESKHLLDEVSRLSRNEFKQNLNNSEFISATCELIEKSISSQEKYKAIYYEIIKDLDEHQREIPRLLRDFYKISAFKFVTGINSYFGVNN
ncbi:hypothetical protein QT13_15025 [Pectobacterium brasiliense]|uniref:hypothetical protein n=1 Tax=Pectobacterium TaxID=122277 RepID=UPI00057D4842|nr:MULTISPECIES: hypothetical protein [Pectobacterium]KHS67102.1 hypothetical protein QT13_15025 [Pectobacterium brasiliense]KHT35129.1 hypothetical protein RC99_10985 [Pectobacterium carotovorum subsp. carotovorum]UFT93030.1 hypothetical protein LQF52_14335 [Pectobacterium carotovorum]